MNTRQAAAKLQKLLGPRGAWRINDRAPTAEDRERAKTARPALVDEETKAKLAMERRRAELLADPEYRRLVADWQQAQRRANENLGVRHSYRITVGIDSGFALVVKAEGDNWQEIIDKLEAGAKVAA